LSPTGFSRFHDEIEIKDGRRRLKTSLLAVAVSNSVTPGVSSDSVKTVTVGSTDFGRELDLGCLRVSDWRSKRGLSNVYHSFKFLVSPGFRLERMVGQFGRSTECVLLPCHESEGVAEAPMGREFDCRDPSLLKEKLRHVIRTVSFYLVPLGESVSLDHLLDQASP
jgi:hypothetical protein